MSSASSWATIEFPVAAIDEEIKALLVDWGVEFEGLTPKEHEDGPRVEVEGGIFNLHHGDVAYGEFQDLEETLKNKKVPFDRQTGMDWDISPCTRIYRPGDPKFDRSFPNNDDGETVVSVEKIQETVEAYSSPECRGQLYGALTYFLSINFPAYPPLADFVKEEAAPAA